jgi:hypothetical protein
MTPEDEQRIKEIETRAIYQNNDHPQNDIPWLVTKIRELEKRLSPEWQLANARIDGMTLEQMRQKCSKLEQLEDVARRTVFVFADLPLGIDTPADQARKSLTAELNK